MSDLMENNLRNDCASLGVDNHEERLALASSGGLGQSRIGTRRIKETSLRIAFDEDRMRLI